MHHDWRAHDKHGGVVEYDRLGAPQPAIMKGRARSEAWGEAGPGA